MDVRLPDGTVISNVPDNITRAALTERLSRNGYDVSKLSGAPAPQATEPAAVSAGRAVNSVPRQLGLTARYALEGPAEAAQIVTEPIAGLMRLAGLPTKPLGKVASGFADWVGLPKPDGANERVIADATKLLAGAGGVGAAARAAGGAVSPLLQFAGGGGAGTAAAGATQNVGQALSANMPQQLTSAAGAGLASGASREAGGNEGMQLVAGLLGGVAGGMAPGMAGSAAASARARLAPKQTDMQIDAQISRAFATRDIDYAAIPERVKQSLRTELRYALQAGKEVDPAALARFADFRATGVAPTRGMVSLDPVQITREQNLAKIGANSSDGALHGLPRMQNENNRVLITRLNELGGASEVDPLAAGRMLTSSVQGTQAGLREAERQAWNAARAAPGYTQAVSPEPLNAVNRALGDEGMMGFMSPTISRYMEAFQTGQQPFTPQAYRNLQSMLAGEMAKGGNEAAAAGIARRALESSQLRPLTNTGGRDFGTAPVTAELAGRLRAHDAQPAAAIDLVDRARGATRAAYGYEDSSTLVRSVLSDGASADPARIAQRFVIGGTPDEAAVVAREVGPAGREMIRNALATHIKRQALSGAADEVGKVSQSQLNAAVRSIGDEKLALFFSPEEISQLRSVARVASYAQAQPVGSAVNNSNSGALALGRGADLLSAWARKVPLGQQIIADPLQNVNVWLTQRQAENVLPGLLGPVARPPAMGLLGPGIAAGGLLAAPVVP